MYIGLIYLYKQIKDLLALRILTEVATFKFKGSSIKNDK